MEVKKQQQRSQAVGHGGQMEKQPRSLAVGHVVKQLRSQAVGHKAETALQSEWPLVDQLVDHQLSASFRKNALSGKPDPFSGTGGLKGLPGILCLF